MPSIQDAWQWAVNTCNASNVGYSQAYRNQQTVNGITYYDCSSFINYALLAGGFSTPSYAPDHNAFTTYSEPTVLSNLGFHRVTDGTLKAGDIGVSNNSRQQHTEMIYAVNNSGTAAQWMGAHSPNYALDRQVSIGTYWSANWFDTLWRYENGATGTDEPPEDNPDSGMRVSAYVIAAMCGNFWTESNINPGIWENLDAQTSSTVLNHGYGLGQWTNTGGNVNGRLYQLMSFLQENGYPLTSGDGQMEFLMNENYWTHSDAYGFSSLREYLVSDSTDIAMLTHAFNWCWEGIHNATWNIRVTQAQECYNYIVKHKNDETITQWISGNRWLTDKEKYNNAVMLYRWISQNIGDDTIPVTGTKNKVIFMLRNRFLYS